MWREKLLALAASAVLAVLLCPGLAFAADLSAGDVGAADSAAAKSDVSAQAKAKTVTVYVLVGTGDSTTTYTYNKNGLLASYGSYIFGYKGANLKSIKNPDSSYKYSVKSKGGLVKSFTRSFTSSYSKYYNTKTTYSYSYNGAGGLKTIKTSSYSMNYQNSVFWKKLKKTGSTTTEYTLNKKNLPIKVFTTTKYLNGSTSTSSVAKYAYDKKKNLKKSSPKVLQSTNYKYGYSKGHPTFIKTSYVSQNVDYYTGKIVKSKNSYTTKLNYEARQVNKKYADAVARQQWALINNNMNAAFGGLNIGVNN